MAGGSLLTLLDDIASILDDVSILSKKAAAKTAGVLGDDLALNAQQVSGVVAKRELPVVWAVAKGSFVNKLILVPLALLISAFAPWAVTPLLMVGGLYLCFEGCEKLAHRFLHREETPHTLTSDPEPETDKIKGAIRTDFVLSAEIIAITLGIVAGENFPRQVMVLSIIAVVMTVGVYGLVAGIVKLDDAGLYLSAKSSPLPRAAGRAILAAAPVLMKTLSVAGTVAMFLVGGGIIVHGIPPVHHFVEHTAASLRAVGGASALLAHITPSILNGIGGFLAGTVALLIYVGARKILRKDAPSAAH